MNRENTKKLLDKFEFFYPETGIQESLMSFGFECADGWFDLIWKLCENIEKELEKEEPKEKTKHLLKGRGHFEVVQVKEKFGTLRFYSHGSTDKIHELIQEAENKSEVTCEGCGNPGERRNMNNWIKTLCSKCAKKRD